MNADFVLAGSSDTDGVLEASKCLQCRVESSGVFCSESCEDLWCKDTLKKLSLDEVIELVKDVIGNCEAGDAQRVRRESQLEEAHKAAAVYTGERFLAKGATHG